MFNVLFNGSEFSAVQVGDDLHLSSRGRGVVVPAKREALGWINAIRDAKDDSARAYICKTLFNAEVRA